MVRLLTALALIAFATHSQAQFNYNGPFSGTVAWSAGTWSPGTPPVGGATGATISINALGGGTALILNNDRGNPFQLSALDLNGLGGSLTVGSAASNTLEFVGAGAINQNGIGNAAISSTITLSAVTAVSTAGTGNLRLSGIISGGSGLSFNGAVANPYNGLIDVVGANSYGGGTAINSGNVRVGNNTAFGSGTVTFNGGTLGATTTVTLANPFTLAGNFTYSGGASLTLTGALTESTRRNVILSASTAAGTLTLQGTNVYSGFTRIEVNNRIGSNGPVIANLTLSGVNGSITGSSSIEILGGGTFTLDNAAVGANNDNRVGDLTPILISGGALVVNGANGGATNENAGPLTASGAVFVTMNAGTTGNTGTTLSSDSLSRSNRGQIVFRGNNTSFGGPIAANVANLTFDTAPALDGSGGTAGTPTAEIITYAVAGTSTTSTGTELATYGANGIRPLAAAEYAATVTSGTTTINNVKLAAAAAITAPTSIKALVISTTTPFTGSTSTLTVSAGTVLVTSTSSVPAAMTLDFGAAEGNLFINATTTIDGVLAGSNGFNKTGTSPLTLNNTGNTITGTLTINQGNVQFSNPAALGSLTDIVVNGRAGTSGNTPGVLLTLSTGSATLNKDAYVTDGFFSLSSSGGTLVYAGKISGPGGVITSGTVELTNVANDFTGQFRQFNGTLIVSSDAPLGLNPNIDIGTTATTGLRLSGNWNTNKGINFSFSTQIDTNGFDFTCNQPITGNPTTLNKINAGIWTIAQGGTLGQSLTTSTLTTATTINIAAGELRVTNTSGSATGTSTLNINGTSIFSGTGAVAGATTIATTASIRPGTGGTTLGTLTLQSNLTINGTYSVDATLLTSDKLTVLGSLTLGTASILDLTAGTYDPTVSYTLTTQASLSGTFITVNGLPVSHALSYSATSIMLVPVPEPALLLGLTLLGAFSIRRRM